MTKHYPRGPAFKVTISQENISTSMKRDSSHCMIAEAVKEAFPDARNISVDLQTIRFSDFTRKLRFTYLTPRTAQLALVRFDQGDETLSPFSFHLQGAHVTAAGMRAPSLKRALSDEVRQQRKDAAEKGRSAMRDHLAKATLATGSSTADAGAVMRRVGGKTPPRMKSDIAFARRRAFGLRALAR